MFNSVQWNYMQYSEARKNYVLYWNSTGQIGLDDNSQAS